VGCLLLWLVLLLFLLLAVICGIALLVHGCKAHLTAGCWASLLVVCCFPSLLRLLTPCPRSQLPCPAPPCRSACWSSAATPTLMCGLPWKWRRPGMSRAACMFLL
jgi:hypothetical protein